MLNWLVRHADLLVGQAPGVAAELLTRAVASTSADSAQHDRLASRLADALYRLGDRAAAEQVANRVLEYAAEPDLVVDLHWTLAQCRMLAGSPRSPWPRWTGRWPRPGSRPGTAPGCSRSPRGRTLNSSEVETAGRVAATALRGGVGVGRQLGHGLGAAGAGAGDFGRGVI